MREIDRVPDYLVAGLVKSKEEDDRIAAQESDVLWQRVEVSGVPVIVRSANRRNRSARRASNRTRG